MLFPSGCRLLVPFGWIAEDGGDRRARLPWLLTEPVADFVARTRQETAFWEISPVKSRSRKREPFENCFRPRRARPARYLMISVALVAVRACFRVRRRSTRTSTDGGPQDHQ